MTPASTKVWGPWATMGIVTFILVIQIIVGSIVGAIAGVIAATRLDSDELNAFLEGAQSNGMLLSAVIIVSTPITVGWLLLFTAPRKGASVTEYFALHKVSLGRTMKYIVLAVALCVAADLIALAIGRPYVPDHMAHTYTTVGFVPILWVVMIVFAPLGEESLFRGFLYAGIATSRIGANGAILIASVLPSILALSYGTFDAVYVFALGCAFGIARKRCNSLLPGMAMSMAANFYNVAALTLYMNLY